MSDKHAERNLLVGFLALQLDFIRREQFLAGMNAWIADKSQSLADILQAQGALPAQVRPLLDGLVVQHLALHQDDPRTEPRLPQQCRQRTAGTGQARR